MTLALLLVGTIVLLNSVPGRMPGVGAGVVVKPGEGAVVTPGEGKGAVFMIVPVSGVVAPGEIPLLFSGAGAIPGPLSPELPGLVIVVAVVPPLLEALPALAPDGLVAAPTAVEPAPIDPVPPVPVTAPRVTPAPDRPAAPVP